jgi:GDP-mannose 6-dehydrogenase
MIENIAVFGLGYVGCVSASCFAHLGFRVIGVDRDQYKVESVLQGRAPFYEPGLEHVLRDSVANGRLTATGSAAEGLREADVALICVGTPSEHNGNLGLGQLRRVVADIAHEVSGRSRPLIIAVRSTVFPGTCEEVVETVLRDRGDARIGVVSNPEFLREGQAMKDFFEPSLVVVGGSDSEPVRQVADLYASLPVKPCLVSLRTAEMIKYACNAFHALKISFANEIGSLCAHVGVEGGEVMGMMCQDVKLNISPAYLKPGFAFGGSCLPKDLRALVYRASHLDLELPLLEASLISNEKHLERAIQSVLDLAAKRIGVIGVAFKDNTDDLRESPAVKLLEYLIGRGRQVRVFDPHISLDSIYGSNRAYILNAIPHIGRLLDASLSNVLRWADHLVITQKLTDAVADRIRESSLPVLDLAASSALTERARPGAEAVEPVPCL